MSSSSKENMSVEMDVDSSDSSVKEEQTSTEDEDEDEEDKDEEEPQPLEIGDRCQVRRPDGEFDQAKIIDTRGEKGEEMEYHVHYVGSNRRMDEWVPRDRITSTNTDVKAASTSPKRLSNELEPSRTGVLTRNQARRSMQMSTEKIIDKIQFGKHEINACYLSPYPAGDYGLVKKLWICEFCLKYMKLEETLRVHLGECNETRPPGKEVYRKETHSIWEVDGSENKLYCENLCLLAKLFLAKKTLPFEVEAFWYYVLCEVDEAGAHLVGYFSKEKAIKGENNVSCILTLPPCQRQGYGKLLIAFSYELSKIQKVAGSPEKPLSESGAASYRSYWTWAILEILRTYETGITVDFISNKSSIALSDVRNILQSLKLLKEYEGIPVISGTKEIYEELLQKPEFKPPRITVDASCICLAGHPSREVQPKTSNEVICSPRKKKK